MRAPYRQWFSGVTERLVRWGQSASGALPAEETAAARSRRQMSAEKERCKEDAALMASIAAARREWQQAYRCFQNATDPDLIDVAILNLGAAERRYMYLLKLARLRGLAVEVDLSRLQTQV